MNASLNILEKLTPIEVLRNQAKTQEKSLQLKNSPLTLWPLICNTDLLNQKVGLSATQNAFSPLSQGGSLLEVETKAAGLNQVYQELPFEWQEGHALSVERIYSQGLFKYLRFSIRTVSEGEGCLLTGRIDYVPAVPDLLITTALKESLQKMAQFWQNLDQALTAGAQGLEVFFNSPTPRSEAALSQLSERWQELQPQSPIPAQLARYVLLAPERYAGRLRPFELASLYGFNPLDTLRFCLRATWAGDLHLRWDLRCPGCKGPKENNLHLQEVAHQAYCPSCAAGFQVGFDQNLELSFFPNTALRVLQEDHFCAGSPANTPHLAGQLNLWPEQKRHWELHLPLGNYVLRSLSFQQEGLLVVTEQGAASGQLSLENLADQPLEFAPGASLTLYNSRPYFCTLQIEKQDWDPQVCTGALVSSLPEFKELFASETPAEVLPVSRLSFLELRWEGANSPGERQELLSQLLQSRAGVVLNQDAAGVRVVFQDPLDGLRALWSLHVNLNLLNSGRPPDQTLYFRAGLAEGPCETQADSASLNYQGLAVEMAEFQLELAAQAEVVISAEIFADADLQWFLYRVRAGVTEQTIALPGGQNWPFYTLRFAGGQV